MRKEDLLSLTLWALFGVSAFVAMGFFEFVLTWPWRGFLAINVATFVLYGFDKLMAMMGTHRVSERALHTTAFLFGSPGALLAMHLFRHKTHKISFQFVLAFVILIQVLILVAIERFVLREAI